MRAPLILGGAVLSAFCTLAHSACPAGVNMELPVSGSQICVYIEDAGLAKKQPLLRVWIDRSAHIVAGYYTRFPAPLIVIRLQGMDGSGVGGGRTTNDSGLMIQMRVGRETTTDTLAADL